MLKLTTHELREAVRPYERAEPAREIPHTFNVSYSTISRLRA